MRSGETGCRMIRKKLSGSVSLVGQEERQKEVADRLDDNCRQAKQFCEETFWVKEKRRKCEEKERRLIGN